MAAAEWWERGGEPAARRRRQDIADLQAVGADISEIKDAQPLDFEVFPENWDAVMFYIGLRTQWRFAPFGGVIGLDYPGVEAAMRMQRIPAGNRPALFGKIQIMEGAALVVLNEKTPDGKQRKS